MVWTARPDGFRFNRRWLEYAGLSLEEALRANFPAMLPEDQLEFLSQWEHAVQTETPVEREIRLRRADEGYFWFLHRIVPFKDESGNVFKWIATITDIHALKRSEKSLREERNA
jgi:PAS domain S-box-containing protein